MRIPTYSRKVKKQEVMRQAPRAINVNRAAFGENIAAAMGDLGSAVEQGGQRLANWMQKKQKEEEDKRVLEFETQFRKENQERLYGEEIEELDAEGNTIKKPGLLVRQGDGAKNATVGYDSWFEEKRKEVLGGDRSDRERELIEKALGNVYMQSRGGVIRHEAAQGKAAYTSALKNNVMAKLDANELDSARGDLISSKDRISPEQFDHINKMIDGKEFDNLKKSTWQGLSEMKLADGNADFEKQSKAIDAMGVADDKKETLKSYIKAKGHEAAAIKREQDKATDLSFMNEIYSTREKGGSMDDALVSVSKYGDGAWDKAQKEEIVKKLYSNPVKTDPVTYMALWTAIKDGQAGEQEVYQALQENKISGSDFVSLGKLSHGENGKVDGAIKRLNIVAKDKFNKRPTKQKEFLYNIQEWAKENPDASEAEVYKYGMDSLDDDPETEWWFGIGGDPKFETELARRDAKNQAWGTIEQDFGRDTIKAIGHEMNRTKKSFDLNDVNQYIDEFGQDSLRDGGQANNAIKQLQDMGLPASVANIKHYLQRYATTENKKEMPQ